MTPATDEITPRQLIERLMKSMRREITVRAIDRNTLVVEGIEPPMIVEREFRLSFIATPASESSRP